MLKLGALEDSWRFRRAWGPDEVQQRRGGAQGEPVHAVGVHTRRGWQEVGILYLELGAAVLAPQTGMIFFRLLRPCELMNV